MRSFWELWNWRAHDEEEDEADGDCANHIAYYASNDSAAMNCEFSRSLSSNETEVGELNGTFVIKRTSLRLESGVGPMG